MPLNPKLEAQLQHQRFQHDAACLAEPLEKPRGWPSFLGCGFRFLFGALGLGLCLWQAVHIQDFGFLAVPMKM